MVCFVAAESGSMATVLELVKAVGFSHAAAVLNPQLFKPALAALSCNDGDFRCVRARDADSVFGQLAWVVTFARLRYAPIKTLVLQFYLTSQPSDVQKA